MHLEERSMRKSGSFARTARTGAVLVAAGVAGAAEAQNRVLNLQAGGNVVVPHNASQNPGNTITIEFWALLTPGTTGWPVGKRTGSTGAYSIQIYGSQPAGSNAVLGPTYFGCGEGPAAVIQQGTWIHVAYVGQSGVGRWTYVNGVLTADSGLSPCNMLTTTAPLAFGAAACCSSTQFFGRLDNIRLWSTARTAQQIAETALVEFTPAQAAAMPGLIGSWSFDDGTATDARGVNNGTLQGAATTTIDDGAGLASQFDCNSDGILDAYQIAQGELGDDNANAIPDCCEGSASCIPCPGDIDRNGVANGVDLAMILTAWGTSGAKYPGTDINGDGGVDGADMTFVLSSWGVCP
jgi:hypothetical protein